MGAVPFWSAFTEGFEGDLVPSNDPWKVCVLGDFPLPGMADINGSAAKRIDVQPSNGKDGGVLIERGYKPGQIDIDLEMWTPEQWDRFQQILPILFRPQGKLDLNDHAKKKRATAAAIEATRMAAVPIRHPKAALLKITSVLIEQVTLPRPGSVEGSQVVTLKCIQYTPPTEASAVRKVTGVKPPPIDPRAVIEGLGNEPAKPSEAGDGGVDGAEP